MKYEPIPFSGPLAAEAAVVRDERAALLYVPVAAALESDDLEWAQDLCVRLATHPHFNVRGNAILGFGHQARRFGTLDRARVEPLLRAALRDAHPYVRGHGHDAADELRHFLGWELEDDV